MRDQGSVDGSKERGDQFSRHGRTERAQEAHRDHLFCSPASDALKGDIEPFESIRCCRCEDPALVRQDDGASVSHEDVDSKAEFPCSKRPAQRRLARSRPFGDPGDIRVESESR
ncbi:hypothetical protein GCM10025780_00660 [Frondihabitans cladoniiphilus]|uniref:Uncharacterized protein n=1 Tax=Frondihabitans cladoniiphilus TaxID=715785 RepID=A0ABP8VJ19_9MICO